MQVAFQNNPQRPTGLFDRLSSFPAQWVNSLAFLKSLSVQISEYFFEHPWPLTTKFKIPKQASLDVYSHIFNLCTQKQSRTQRIYASFQDILREFLSLKTPSHYPLMDSLQFYLRLWTGYKQLLQAFLKIFCYVDRYYLPDSNLPSLECKALQLFQQYTINPEKKHMLYTCYFDRLAFFRENYQKTDVMLLDFSKSLKEISSKTGSKNDQELFDFYLKQSTAFYEMLKNNWIVLPCHIYLENVGKLEQEEFVLFCKTIQTDSERLAILSQKFGGSLIKPYQQHLLLSETGLKHMLAQGKFQHLQLTARLLKSYHHIQLLKKEFYKYLRSLGFDLFLQMPKNSEPMIFIRKFAQFYANKMAFTFEAFPQFPQMLVQCRNAMETVVHLNDEEFRIAENLASYTDQLFRQHPDEQKEREVLNVFECLSSKDVFMSLYEKDLSNRLLRNRCKSITQETQFLYVIKQKCGELFTQAAEGRIQDFTKAAELEKEYKSTRSPQSFIYTVKVLSKNNWLSDLKIETDHKTFDFEWPPEVEGIKLDFEGFFVSLHTSKHLEYLPLLSTVRLTFPLNRLINHRPYCEITTNLLQASMLIFIDRVARPVGMPDLLSIFHGEESLIRAQLEPLVNLFIESKPDPQNPDSSLFSINNKFSTQESHIEVLALKQQKPVRKESINMEREIAVQSVIVKILKLQKRMDIYSLFERIDKNVKQFKPSVSMLKQAIEKLIEKEYIERDKLDMNILIYKS